MGFKLKNNFGILQIDPGKVVLPDGVKQNPEAYLFSENAELFDENDQLMIYDGKPIFFENQHVNFTFVPISNKDHEYSISVRGIEQFQSRKIGDQVVLTGPFQFSNSVGYTDISVRDRISEKDIINLRTEIFPQKIDYKTDFYWMLHEVTEIIYNLIFDYFKTTYLRTVTIDTTHQALSEWLVILKYLFDSLLKHIDLVLKTLHYKIDSSMIIKEISAVRRLDKRARKWVLQKDKFLNKKECGYKLTEDTYITHLPEHKKFLSYDTFENQYLVWAMKQIVKKIDEITAHLQRTLLTGKGEAQLETTLLRSYKRKLLNRLNDQYLRNVSDFGGQLNFSTVLTMAPGYKDFYKSFLKLRRGLSISAPDIYELDLKDVSQLYEYWCFLKILKILRGKEKYNLENIDFIRLEHNKFVSKLQKGKESKVTFVDKSTKEEIAVYFNKGFSASDYITYTQKPDNFIEFRREGYKTPFWYLFDAKYRFVRATEEGYPSTKIENGPPQDTIGQMHRYRDAILQKQAGRQSYSSAIKSLGGIILFPFPGDEKTFKEHPFYASISKVNIGAIPLHPGRENKLFEEFLDNLFSVTPESIFENVIDYDKSEYVEFIHQVGTDVLIGLIPNDNYEKRKKFHLEKRFYHTKFMKKYDIVSSDKRIFRVKYLALYSKTEQRIIGYAIVNDVSYVTRRELQRLGANWKHAEEEYLLFKLSEINLCNLKYSGMNRQGKVYTNFFSFIQFLRGIVDEHFLKLDNYEFIRLWKEVKNVDPEYRFTKKRQTLTFCFEGKKYECIQDKNEKALFFINGQKYRLSQDLKENLQWM